MGGSKKKQKTKLIQQAKQQRRLDRQIKAKLHKKMSKQKGDRFKLSQQYLEYYQAFNQEIAPLRIRLKDVGGDGNCLFRAFADQMDGAEETHVLMRQQASRFMQQNQQFFRPFLDQDQDGSFEDYLKLMRTSGQWGGHLQLQALSECFRCIVVVHKRQLEQFMVRPIVNQPTQIIHLGYFQHQDFQHYVSIRSLQDQSNMPALLGLKRLNTNMYGHLLMLQDPQEMIMRQQLQQLGLMERVQAYEYEQRAVVPEQQPYPGYPRNKKCKCGSKIEYKKCCFKQWQIKRAQYIGNQ